MTTWQKIVNWFKKLLGKTSIDDKALEALLNLAITKFIDTYGNTAFKASKSFIDKVHKSIDQSIEDSTNKIDDMFIPYIDNTFKTISTDIVEKFFVKDNIELTLKNLQSYLLDKYKAWQVK